MVTFEANLGAGWIHASGGGPSDNSDAALAGLSLGVGGWISPDVAITGRIAGLTLSQNGAHLSHVFAGPSNFSTQVNPGFYSDQGTTITYTGIGFLLGYQHL